MKFSASFWTIVAIVAFVAILYVMFKYMQTNKNSVASVTNNRMIVNPEIENLEKQSGGQKPNCPKGFHAQLVSGSWTCIGDLNPSGRTIFYGQGLNFPKNPAING